MVSKPPLTGQVPGGAVQDAATPARLSPPPRPRRRRRRLEPGCGAVRQARESGADGSIKRLVVSGGGVCTEIITSIVEYFFCLINYNSTYSSLEDVVSGPGVLSEPPSCQACAWLELRWGNPSRIPKNMCIYP